MIAGEPGRCRSDDPGWVWVQSGRTGRVIHRFEGKTGDQNGFAITDAGDTDRDGVHDILSGAPRQTGDTEGHAYLYSGRTGRLLHTFAGAVTGDAFGAAVTSADVNRDGRTDLVVGAPVPARRRHRLRLLRPHVQAALQDPAARPGPRCSATAPA